MNEETEVKRLTTAKAVDRKHTSGCAEDAEGVAQIRKPRDFVRAEVGLLNRVLAYTVTANIPVHSITIIMPIARPTRRPRWRRPE